MPGPHSKPITDHHKHREALADDAFSKIDDGVWSLQQLTEDLCDTGNAHAADAWRNGYREIQVIVERLRKASR